MAGTAALWGSSYMFIKLALDDGLSPGAIVCLRTALGAAVLLPLAIRTGALAAARARWPYVVGVSVVQVVIPFLLITLGEQHIASSLAGILVAAAPLWNALLASRFDRTERPSGWSAVGVLLGIAGVVLLFGVDLAGDRDELLGGAMVLLAALCYAIGPLVVKHRLRGVAPVGVSGGMMLVAAAVTLPLLLADPPPHAPGAGTIAGLVVLGAGSTGVAFLWWYTLMREVGPGRGTIVSYLAPPFAVLYGTLFLGEELGAGAVAGIVLILLGSWLGVGGRSALSRSGPSRSTEPAPVRAR